MTNPSAAVPDEIAALGPYFAFAWHDGDSAPGGPWRVMNEVVDGRSPALRDRVTAVRGHLAAGGGRPPQGVELRVAASVAHLGLTARLISPLLALTALYGRPPLLDLARTWWQPELGGVFPLSLPRWTAGPGTPRDDAGAVLDGPVRQLVDAVAAVPVSRHILWGNVASAVNGAATVAGASGTDLGRRVRETATRLLNHPDLRDAHTRSGANGAFRRGSCCLIYRAALSAPGAPVPAGALCGDCVLAGRVGRNG
ncbi:(2Fe-2S)-binding protein [Streptomyces sp. SL13]|uniref:(2Fe-2S)-binding protein n=1 Tax=Streptantibioticus silvisoli TaxID=2705255 RepID=A0AA90H9W9_9ACTN|nr:(2Fe-2S)-binding protein [Streptantibioticus silvisoli]MDI5972857.1 (2Fe-2S)-binding protein [Streptantibioticus silvisoli]